MAPATPARRRRGITLETFAILSCTALLLVLRIADTQLTAAPRAWLFDAFQRAAPRESAGGDVAIVDIDEASLARLGQWPWPRDLMARLTDAIAAQQPRIIGFDILFAEPDRLSQPAEANDLLFARSLESAGGVLGVATAETTTPGSRPARIPSLIMSGGDVTAHLHRFEGYVGNLAALEKAALGLGLIGMELDRDGVARRVPALAMVGPDILPALEVEMLRIAGGAQPLRIVSAPYGVRWVAPAGVPLATDPAAAIWLHYARPDRSRYVSAAALIAGEVDPQALTGKFVLVGSTASGLHNLYMTPLRVPIAGVEVRAQFLDNLLLGAPLSRPIWATAAELSCVLGLGLLAILLRRRLTRMRLPVCLALACVAVAALSWFAFDNQGLLLDATYPMLSAVFLALLVLAQNVRADREAVEAALVARETRLRELQVELLALSRLATVEQMSSALAHELNQPLAAIANFVQASRRLLSQDAPERIAKVGGYLEKAVGQVDRAAAIITGLRNLVQRGETARAPEDVNETVTEAVETAFIGAPKEPVAVVYQLAAGLPKVPMNRIQIQQVILNLVRNAVEAMRGQERGTLTIRSAVVDGGQVAVEIADTGPGIDPGFEERLFKPFATTKESGMGIGLSISQSIVTAHGGELRAERNADRGMCFRFTLPISAASD
jgi:signal transduction histidine kinase